MLLLLGGRNIPSSIPSSDFLLQQNSKVLFVITLFVLLYRAAKVDVILSIMV